MRAISRLFKLWAPGTINIHSFLFAFPETAQIFWESKKAQSKMQKLYLALCGPCTWKATIKLFKQDFFSFFGITGETESPDDRSGPSPQWSLDKTSSISCNLCLSRNSFTMRYSIWIYSGSHITYHFDIKTKPFFSQGSGGQQDSYLHFQSTQGFSCACSLLKETQGEKWRQALGKARGTVLSERQASGPRPPSPCCHRGPQRPAASGHRRPHGFTPPITAPAFWTQIVSHFLTGQRKNYVFKRH